MPIYGTWFRPRDRIFPHPSKYFSILMLKYDSSFSVYTCSSSRSAYSPKELGDYCDSLPDWSPTDRTIVIVLSKHHNTPILRSDKIVSFDESLKDKPASSILSQEIVPPYSFVPKYETHLLRRRLWLPVALLLNNKIVTQPDIQAGDHAGKKR